MFKASHEHVSRNECCICICLIHVWWLARRVEAARQHNSNRHGWTIASRLAAREAGMPKHGSSLDENDLVYDGYVI